MEKLGHGRRVLDRDIDRDRAAKMVNSALPARLCYQARRQVVVLEEKPPRTLLCSVPQSKQGRGLMNTSHGAAHDVSVRSEAAILAALGRRVALRLGIPFVDADAEIEKAAGMSISDIFAIRGEPEFRAGEAHVIARLLEAGPQVLAT